MNLLIKLMTATTLVASLAACGGGGGDSTTPTPPPAPPAIEGSIRVIHASSDAPRINVVTGSTQLTALEKIDYKSGTGFANIEIGTYPVSIASISADGSLTTVIDPIDIVIEEDSETTIIALDKIANIESLILTHNDIDVASDKVSVQIIHASPEASEAVGGPVDVYVTATDTDINNVQPLGSFDFKGILDPVSINAADYRIRVTPTGSKEPVFDTGETGVALAGGSELLIVAVDNTAASDSPISLLVDNGESSSSLADSSSIAKVRVVHTAPDIANIKVFAIPPDEDEDSGETEFIDTLSYLQDYPGDDSYVTLEPGDYHFYVAPITTGSTGTIGDSEYDVILPLQGDTFYTLYVNGKITSELEFGFTLVTSDNRSLSTESRLTFVHSAIDAGTIDVYVTPAGDYTISDISSGTVAPTISGVQFNALANVSGFISLTEGNYDIRIVANTDGEADTIDQNAVRDIALNTTLADGGVYKIAAVGPSADETVTEYGAVLLTD